MEIKSYKDLVIWQKSMDLVTETYKLTKLLPQNEMYSLSDQIRRAAVSVPSNIAEGFGRKTTQDYIRFLTIAHGSLCELETQFEICRRVGYLSEKEIDNVLSLSGQIGKQLNNLIYSLKEKRRG